MKKVVLTLVIFTVLSCSFIGCSTDKPSEYPECSAIINTELGCVELCYNDIVYRPFGVFVNNSFRGTQIAVRADMQESKICQVKGYPPEEWIIEYLDMPMGGGDMLFKAVDTTEIPEELAQYQEYEY